MQIALLAAGRGTRLTTQTASLPKTLIPVGGKPLCDHILDHLKLFDIETIFVIGGFEYLKLHSHLKDYLPNLKFLENKNYQKGNLLTLLVAQQNMSQSFCVMNADHLFSVEILSRLFQATSSNPERFMVCCDFDRLLTEDDMKMKRRDDGTLKIMKKNFGKHDGGYIGITFVPHQKREIYFRTAADVLQEKGDAICVEEVVNALCDRGETVEIVDCSGSSWFEVDTKEDLERAGQLIGKIKIS